MPPTRLLRPRLLRQPGPPRPQRIEMVRDDPYVMRFTLAEGSTLHEALAEPLLRADLPSAMVRFAGGGMDPLRYVQPARSPDDTHVAFYSETFAPVGVQRIEYAQISVGSRDGAPFVHCHATWRGANGVRRGGHILPTETIVAQATEVTVCGFRNIRLESRPDAETNFSLMLPTGGIEDGHAVVARIGPNEDILTAIEDICRANNIQHAAIHGTLGSLVGAHFKDDRTVDDIATEVLVREGYVRYGVAALDLLVIDMQGEVHEGWLTHGQNPVCITFDIVLTDLRAG
jgi:predicted DNA-binding protein with PD1-like motif